MSAPAREERAAPLFVVKNLSNLVGPMVGMVARVEAFALSEIMPAAPCSTSLFNNINTQKTASRVVDATSMGVTARTAWFEFRLEPWSVMRKTEMSCWRFSRSETICSSRVDEEDGAMPASKHQQIGPLSITNQVSPRRNSGSVSS